MIPETVFKKCVAFTSAGDFYDIGGLIYKVRYRIEDHEWLLCKGKSVSNCRRIYKRFDGVLLLYKHLEQLIKEES